MIWAVIVIPVIVAVLVYFEWRSWNKPLGRSLEDTPRFSKGSGSGGAGK
jgi:hypothetical protein